MGRLLRWVSTELGFRGVMVVRYGSRAVRTEGDDLVVAFSWCRLKPSGMGEVRGIGIFAAAKIAHLSDDETVAKMGHPVLVVRLDV